MITIPWPCVFPFTELRSHAWMLVNASAEHVRSPQAEPVRTVVFANSGDRAFTFDVNRQGQMVKHATFADADTTLIVDCPHAVAVLAGADPDVPASRFADIPGISVF